MQILTDFMYDQLLFLLLPLLCYVFLLSNLFYFLGYLPTYILLKKVFCLKLSICFKIVLKCGYKSNNLNSV